MSNIFESARLLCRRIREEDIKALHRVYSNPVAMRWVGDGQPLAMPQCENWFEVTQKNYVKYGYGMFALEEKSSGVVIGFCGLVHPKGQPEAEIKYAFLQSHWGQGFASEAVPALLAYGESQHALCRVIATVAGKHEVSQRVLEKSGMLLAERREHSKGFTFVYEWIAPKG